MVMMRSSSGMKRESALSMVVLPEPVPPEISTVTLHCTQAERKRRMPGVRVLYCTISSWVMTWRPKRRMLRQGPSSASGGMMALTREPSCRRASTIGWASSMRRPTWETIFSMMCSRCASSLKRTVVSESLPLRSMKTLL